MIDVHIKRGATAGPTWQLWVLRPSVCTIAFEATDWLVVEFAKTKRINDPRDAFELLAEIKFANRNV